jgi:pyruvate-ferredoxin/flavodoxin oxidoreductase
MMTTKNMITVDGNEAVALVAHKINEVIAIYPITPSSSMAELCEEWSAQGRTNLWGSVPEVVELQSEGGASGAVHGALQSGALTTTFTASQGLLLMIPNMFKIAGELTPMCMHVSARTVATHALSIFGDHGDVMACRQTGFGLMATGSGQEAHDFALITQAASLNSRVPFLHFFDGFRTSSEVSRFCTLDDDDIRAILDEQTIREHRERALNPERPVIRGTAHNPDTFFQAREACNKFYDACPGIVEKVMEKFGARTGRRYNLFDYVGHPQAERVVVLMGSGAETADETVEYLASKGEKVGIIKVRLYRPFSVPHFVKALPQTVKSICVLDRTKEPGSVGEPLYQDVVTAVQEARVSGLLPASVQPLVVGGRYGLSSKEFTPACVKAVFDNLGAAKPRNHFTVGINDDVTHLSLSVDETFDVPSPETVCAVFFGLGADGTVGSNKQSAKIIGDEADLYAQGYFVYDSKKSGAITVSHLRFGPKPIRKPYLVKNAQFVACHHFNFLDKRDVLVSAKEGGIFLLSSPYAPEETWDHLPREVQESIIAKKLRFHVIDANKVARDIGMPGRISGVLQTCFFALSEVMPRDVAIMHIKKSIEKQFKRKGDDVVAKNIQAVDETLKNLHEVKVPSKATSTTTRPSPVAANAPEFVRKVTATIMAGKGDTLPVSAFSVDGTWPTATTQWEKRGIAPEIPIWDPKICIQCNKCALICPHAAIRVKTFKAEDAKEAPATFQTTDFKGAKKDAPLKYAVQVAPDDCAGCELCIEICPVKDKSNPKRKALNMENMMERRVAEAVNYDFFLKLPDPDRTQVGTDLKGTQFLRPLFEYSGACSGCGETPYVKLLTQLYGDRLVIANATGCSSIYGGNMPTTPYAVDANGRGPAWANSLFEDNAEFGLGIRLGVEFHERNAKVLLNRLSARVGDVLVKEIMEANQEDEAGILAQRGRVKALREKLKGATDEDGRKLADMADYFVKKSVWIVGGDGWAYDIGYGGLDHVMAMGKKVNILVLDTEVYSNTGGQASKATPMGASAKFAASGKGSFKKDLALMAMSYGNVYVARVAMGAKDVQTVRAFQEAESFPGTSLIIAYSHCIAHGYDLSKGLQQQKLIVASGLWPLMRYDPRRHGTNEPALKLDSEPPSISPREFVKNETRFHVSEKADPVRFEALMVEAEMQTRTRFALFQQMAGGTGKAE